jgi:alpha-ketoglutarate-dependent taurine dioxygenase
MEWFTQRYLNKEKLPLVIEPTDPKMPPHKFFELLTRDKEKLKQSLLQEGGILFRNFPLSSAQDFAAAIKSLDTGKFLDYIGGDSPRNKIAEGIYTSTEAPPDIKIPLHNELSFVKNHPKHIYFFCEIPSPVGGETIIADARKVYKAMDERVKDRFLKTSLKYVSCYYHKNKLFEYINKKQPFHKSWMQVFETESKQEVEMKCRENDFGFKWNQQDWLQINQIRPAMIEHPITKEKVWFNQVHLFDFNPKLLGWWRYVGAKLFYFRQHTKLHEVFFSDNSYIPRKDLYKIMDVLDDQTVAFPWQKGDFLVLDNILTMHGRAPFSGKRRVLAAMTG